MCIIFFFQAEDGIRDIGVTGVQTCALPIYSNQFPNENQDTPFLLCCFPNSPVRYYILLNILQERQFYFAFLLRHFLPAPVFSINRAIKIDEFFPFLFSAIPLLRP